jgi:hypothetical protein
MGAVSCDPPAVARSLRDVNRCLLAGFVVAFEQIREARRIMQEGEIELADGTISLLGDDDFGAAFEVGIVLLIDLFAENEHDDVGVLFNRARFAQVRELWTMIASAAFGSAA